MAAKISIANVCIMDNPSPFMSDIRLEITFDAYEHLDEDIEWKLTYIGSADSNEHDQILDSILVGPVPEGRHKFVFETPPPDPAKIPVNDLTGITVLLLSCAYRAQVFLTIGYYVAIEYTDNELIESPPVVPIIDKLIRRTCAEEPRVTRFAIKWNDVVPVDNTECQIISVNDEIKSACESSALQDKTNGCCTIMEETTTTTTPSKQAPSDGQLQ